MNKLSSLTKLTEKKKKIIGRGYGSGKGGHTVGRGTKGQNSRAGNNRRKTFEGGQNELIHRLPVLRGRKRAKRNQEYIVLLNLNHLNQFEDGDTVTYESLVKKNFIKDGQRVKILNKGKLEKKIKVDGISYSSSVGSFLDKNKE